MGLSGMPCVKFGSSGQAGVVQFGMVDRRHSVPKVGRFLEPLADTRRDAECGVDLQGHLAPQ